MNTQQFELLRRRVHVFSGAILPPVRSSRGGNPCHSILAPTYGTDLQFFIGGIMPFRLPASRYSTNERKWKWTARPHASQNVLKYFSPVSTPSTPLSARPARGCQNRMNGRVGVYFQSGDCGRLGKLVGNKPFKSNSPRAAFDLFRTELKPSPFRLVSRLLRGRRGIL